MVASGFPRHVSSKLLRDREYAVYANMTSVPCWNSDNERSVLHSFTYANKVWTGAKDMKRRR